MRVFCLSILLWVFFVVVLGVGLFVCFWVFSVTPSWIENEEIAHKIWKISNCLSLESFTSINYYLYWHSFIKLIIFTTKFFLGLKKERRPGSFIVILYTVYSWNWILSCSLRDLHQEIFDEPVIALIQTKCSVYYPTAQIKSHEPVEKDTNLNTKLLCFAKEFVWKAK